jgi:hypothetical protein
MQTPSLTHRTFVAARLAASVGWLGLSAAASLPAATYYVDSQTGNDANTGVSPTNAWQTISRANQSSYSPGDSILLRRGCQWHGPGFKARGNGSVQSPITLADYGDPGLTLPLIIGEGTHEPAILLQNVQNWVVRNLELTQLGQTPQNLDPNNEKGKDADQYSDEYMRAVVHVLGLGAPNDPNCGEGCTVRNILLENLIVHDGSWTGVYVSGGYYQLKTATFGVVDNLVIRNIESYNNHKAGIEITCTYYQTRIYATSNVWVLSSHLHDNGGDGAMVGPVRNALLDGNLCEYNGRIRNARVGCWTWDSGRTTIQFNESHHNMTPLSDNKARDGSGFDLDLGTEDGMIQYNWSHDNEGEGYLLLSWPVGYGYSRGESHNIQMRYNLSERDGKKLAGGITVFGGVNPLVIYNNTVYYEPDRLAGTAMFNGEGGALTTSIFGKSGKPVMFTYNNIFITNGRTNSAAVDNNIWTDGAGTFTYNNNIWWRAAGGLRFQWGGSVITSWAGWTGQGFDAAGFSLDPLVIGPSGAGPDAYHLQIGSPAIDHGRAVSEALRGMGVQDGFGASTPQSSYDIGASEYRRIFPDPASPRLDRLNRLPDENWQLDFAGAAGRSYRVDTSSDLMRWTRGGTATEISPGAFQFVDNGKAPNRFYRAAARAMPGVTDNSYVQRFAHRTSILEPSISSGSDGLIMHVADIFTTRADFRTPRAAFRPGELTYWRVRVVDANGKPVPAAVAECEVIQSDGSILTARKTMTGTDGAALFSNQLPQRAARGLYKIRVRNVRHSDYRQVKYNPDTNLESVGIFEVD